MLLIFHIKLFKLDPCYLCERTKIVITFGHQLVFKSLQKLPLFEANKLALATSSLPELK